MPRKTVTENPYSYGPKSDTVRVGQHDLARLLLMFRSLVREQEPGSWNHMVSNQRSRVATLSEDRREQLSAIGMR
ncbi:helicase associated domain-containing protein (plasmid) [Streptomyces sp. NBC_01007]|nr:helicase associated domain-containing protein [Streptomyces sp. NBC_01007]